MGEKTRAANWAGEATTLLLRVKVNPQLGRLLFDRCKTRKAATERVVKHLTRPVTPEGQSYQVDWGISLTHAFEEEDRSLATSVAKEAMKAGDRNALKAAAMEQYGLVDPSDSADEAKAETEPEEE